MDWYEEDWFSFPRRDGKLLHFYFLRMKAESYRAHSRYPYLWKKVQGRA
jgi:hypothetical protein